MRENFTPPEGRITLDNFKSLMPTMPSINGVCIMGLCEPFMNPEAPDILRWLKDEKEYSLSFTTNGMVYLNNNRLDCLTRVSDMVISIDSPDPKTFNFLRGGADLEKVMTSMVRVLDYKRDHGLGRFDDPPMHINSVITSRNFDEIPELIAMLEPYADELTYLMVDPVSRPDYSTLEEPLMLQSMEKEGYDRKLKEFRKLAVQSPLQIIGLDYMLATSDAWRDCVLSWTSPFLEPNGDVYFCYAYRGVLGNVFNERLMRIWNTPDAMAFRAKLLTDDPPLNQCRSCNFARSGWQPDGYYSKEHKDMGD